MTGNTSAHLFDISIHASMRPTVGTLGLFHFWEVTRSPFLHQVLRLTLRYLLQLLPRRQLLLKIRTFRKSDPFSIDDRKGERVLCGVIWEFLFSYFFYLDMCFLYCSTHFVVWNLFWGWHEPLCGQISFMISILSLEVMYLFLWLILLHMFYMWYVVCLYSYASFANQPFYHLF